MKFPYKKVTVEPGKTVSLPLVEVLVGSKKIPTICLVDSGATFPFFHAAIGEQLGLVVQSGEKLTIGGVAHSQFIAYLHRDIPIELGGQQFLINIAFSSDLGAPYNLLGQYNFFEKFRVCFDLRKKEMDIVPKSNGSK